MLLVIRQIIVIRLQPRERTMRYEIDYLASLVQLSNEVMILSMSWFTLRSLVMKEQLRFGKKWVILGTSKLVAFWFFITMAPWSKIGKLPLWSEMEGLLSHPCLENSVYSMWHTSLVKIERLLTRIKWFQ